MPAIVLARLRHQASLLAGHFAEPAAFIRSLHHLLDLYADRTHRPGLSGEPAPLLAAYSVPPPVLRQIMVELSPLASADPQAALALCDALWTNPYLEYRLLATSLLGRVPPTHTEPVLERIAAWTEESLSQEVMITAILTNGLARIRQENPEQVLEFVESWLGSPHASQQKLGLRALRPLLSTPVFENLPVFFRLISPFIREVQSGLRPDVVAVLAALAKLSPRETAHFLRQNLELAPGRDTAWLIRQSLRQFPTEQQENLRVAVRQADRRKF